MLFGHLPPLIPKSLWPPNLILERGLNQMPSALACLLVLLVCLVLHVSGDAPVAKFPLQLSGTITITAHLIDEDSTYPPRQRSMRIYYDYTNKRARADIEAGYEAAKVYVRRYDEDNEYMVRLPPLDDCKRSYLGEVMPYPDIGDTKYFNDEVINGVHCNHFIYEAFDTRVHMYLSSADGAPVKMIQEEIQDQESVPLLTYEYSEVTLGPPDSAFFELPNGYTHEKCDRHVAGFPYLHVFHHFVKF